MQKFTFAQVHNALYLRNFTGGFSGLSDNDHNTIPPLCNNVTHFAKS